MAADTIERDGDEKRKRTRERGELSQAHAAAN